MSLTELMDLANDAEVTQNDFDALINFDDAGNDFFSEDVQQQQQQQQQQQSGVGVGAEEKAYEFDMKALGFDTEPKAFDFAHLAEPRLGERGLGVSAEAQRVGLTADLDTDLGIGLDE
jgi:hypothetical protein